MVSKSTKFSTCTYTVRTCKHLLFSQERATSTLPMVRRDRERIAWMFGGRLVQAWAHVCFL